MSLHTSPLISRLPIPSEPLKRFLRCLRIQRRRHFCPAKAANLHNQLRYQPRPAGLMARAQSDTRVPMKELVEEQ
jgi:hypothetical protein